MTNEELMQLMTEMGLHEGGMENWVPDNAWLLVANRAIEIEREACAKIVETYRIPVGNSVAGEMACEWTHDALKEILDDIRARGNK